ncbi:MAG: hypothetical protein IPO27_03820 [Bacteroidetes bacterium]|nr:hypothetical protein [Bacteroidota bacterium]
MRLFTLLFLFVFTLFAIQAGAQAPTVLDKKVRQNQRAGDLQATPKQEADPLLKNLKGPNNELVYQGPKGVLYYFHTDGKRVYLADANNGITGSNGEKILTGPKGGKYYIGPDGKNVYLNTRINKKTRVDSKSKNLAK